MLLLPRYNLSLMIVILITAIWDSMFVWEGYCPFLEKIPLGTGVI